ncbi:MAG: exodeoxyribonuclease III [Deltaproteobacteria bacterium]
MKILSWNVNGIRSMEGKGFSEWLQTEQPDILCLQETKAEPGQLSPGLTAPPGYISYWNSGKRKGYNGVATYVREKPISVSNSIGIERFDCEGRLLITEHEGFTLLNVYFPNGQMNDERLQYKLDFYDALIDHCEELKKTSPNLVICGDFNTAHREIDLKHPMANAKRSGFLPVERDILDKFLGHGYVDAFRYLYPDRVKYSWWSYRMRAREKNVGWRIDYFYVTNNLVNGILDCVIINEITGSDHCPIGICLK